MTIGNRIYQKRKESGMSQEDLANKLNVSRQTVYKWENDQALPELAKLITIAEIFKVKVGWLINEEKDDNKEEVYKEVSEHILEVVNSKNKVSKKLKFAFISFFILVLIISGALCVKIIELENTYKNLQNNTITNQQHLQNSVNDIVNNVQNTLNEFNSAVLDSNIEIVNYDINTDEISIKFSALPKRYEDNMQVIFHVNEDKIKAEELEDKSFEVIYKTKISNEYNVKAELVSNDTSEFVLLGGLYNISRSTFKDYDISLPFIQTVKWGRGTYDTEFCIYESAYSYENSEFKDDFTLPEAKKYEMALYEDGVKIADYQRDEEHNIDMETNIIYFKRPEGLKLDWEKTYEEKLIVTDEYDRQIEYTYREQFVETNIIKTR